MTEQERAQRNLNPCAEARVAMMIWSHEYAYEQRGGSMDFYDGLSEGRKRQCREEVEKIMSSWRDVLESTQ